MSNKSLTEEQLRQWVLSLPPDSIISLENTLKTIRDCDTQSLQANCQAKKSEHQCPVNSDEESMFMDKSQSRVTSPTSSSMSNQSRSRSGKTYGNGRRNLKGEDVSLDEANRRTKRRERNRLAAANCRKRRQDKIETLQHQISQLKTEMSDLSTDIDQYNSEHSRLNDILTSHKCTIHQQSSAVVTRPRDLTIEKSLEHAMVPGNVFICSLSPQLINLSPLFTPSTMKLLLETLNQEESEQYTAVDSSIYSTDFSQGNNFSRSLSLLNFLSPNAELLNMNVLSSPALKMEVSLASCVSSSNIVDTN